MSYIVTIYNKPINKYIYYKQSHFLSNLNHEIESSTKPIYKKKHYIFKYYSDTIF